MKISVQGVLNRTLCVQKLSWLYTQSVRKLSWPYTQCFLLHIAAEPFNGSADIAAAASTAAVTAFLEHIITEAVYGQESFRTLWVYGQERFRTLTVYGQESFRTLQCTIKRSLKKWNTKSPPYMKVFRMKMSRQSNTPRAPHPYQWPGLKIPRTTMNVKDVSPFFVGNKNLCFDKDSDTDSWSGHSTVMK